tara:strand:+ start:300 stop:743 length:444 start_codon:yes stop_codon:yes gene_type:complete
MAYGRSTIGDYDRKNPIKNWLSAYQGPHGGLGMMSYRALKRDGFNPMTIMNAFAGSGLPSIGWRMQAEMAKDMQPPAPTPAPTPAPPPPPPEPKALTTKATAVGGAAQGVKIKRSNASKTGKNTRGTRSLNRKQRNASMQINNLNLA